MLIHAATAEAPSWTDKLEAWSTFGAAIFTATAVVVAFLVWRHDQRLRREDKQDADAAQARLVFVTMIEALGSKEEGWLGVKVAIRNNSPGAISSVRLKAEAAASTTLIRPIRAIGAGEAPQHELMFTKPRPWPFVRVRPGSEKFRRRVRCRLSFHDSAGLSWTRWDRDEPFRGSSKVSTQLRVLPLLADYLRLMEPIEWIKTRVWKLRTRAAMALQHKIDARWERDTEDKEV
jgi:hypothetical protein